MSKSRKSFTGIVAKLQGYYGAPNPPKVTDPLGMILLEHVAYLQSDERREQAFHALRERVGLAPPEILMPRGDPARKYFCSQAAGIIRRK